VHVTARPPHSRRRSQGEQTVDPPRLRSRRTCTLLVRDEGPRLLPSSWPSLFWLSSCSLSSQHLLPRADFRPRVSPADAQPPPGAYLTTPSNHNVEGVVR
jgi:hypothetical protein